MVPTKIRILALFLCARIAAVHAAVTFYNDREIFLAALEGANVIESTAKRTSWDQDWQTDNRNLPFQQCDLNFPADPDNGINSMQIWNHNNEQLNVAWNGIDSYSFRVYDGVPGRTIETTDSFYAIGFDHISKGQGNGFTINIFGESLDYGSNKANEGQKPKFYGWISDDVEASSFQIENGITTNSGDTLHFMFTNVAYATADESSVTSVGCYVTNAAVRTCSATSWGDPHLVTFDGLKYDVHAKGEVTMVKSMNSTFEIQARLQGAGGNFGAPAVTTGLVVKEDDTLSLPVVQVSFASGPSETTVDMDGCPVQLYVDGQAQSLNNGTDIVGARARIIEDKVVIEYPSTKLRIDMRVHSFRSTCLFSTDFLLADCKTPELLIGLLGSPNGMWGDDWMDPTGNPLEIPEDHRQLRFGPAYEYSTENWCLATASESLFTYEPGTDFYDYALCGNAYDPTLENLVLNPPQDILDLCGDDLGCLIDGGELGAEAAAVYLEDPALDRTFAPTEAPTIAPTKEGCPEPVSGRKLVDLEERWSISEDVGSSFDSNDFDLEFDVGPGIAQSSQLEGILFEQDCLTPYSGSSLNTLTGSLSAIPLSDHHKVSITTAINPASIADSILYSEGVRNNQTIAQIDFCVRASVKTPQSAGDIEVNYLEVIVALFIDLTDGFEIESITVEPRDRCDVQAQEEFLVEGYFCEFGNEADDTYDPGFLTQGELVNICVRPVQRGRDLGIRMTRIASFTFQRETISQPAIADGLAASSGLTDLYCAPGYGICHFSTILYAAFFTVPGQVTGSGVADLQFGGNDPLSVSPRSRRLSDPFKSATHRQLQESIATQVAASAFDLSASIQPSKFDASSSTKGQQLMVSWLLTFVATAVAVASSTILL
ncbi:MAG: hypothetical protein SGILL_004036 [Bacillariaceae sp.]